MNERQFREIVEKYIRNQCTEGEIRLLESWYLQEAERESLITDEPGVLRGYRNVIWEDIKAKTGISRKLPAAGILRLVPHLAAAASLLILLACGLYFITNYRSGHGKLPVYANDIAPGSNKAYLTLADGRKLALGTAPTGEIARQAGIKVSKSADGQLIYEVSSASAEVQASGYNTIETPVGGQYMVKLPDGTRVWLNAASSLRYPVRFALNQRRVELSGEGYFEVAEVIKTDAEKNSNMKPELLPFVVSTASQSIEVLGTRFNINAYLNEPVIKTTLLAGSVRVNRNGNKDYVVLKPGEQSVLNDYEIRVAVTDTESETDWKNGYFILKHESLESIMRKISRWYNVEVEYADKPANVSFGGIVSRSNNISTLLGTLEATGSVKFVVKGRKITVIKQ